MWRPVRVAMYLVLLGMDFFFLFFLGNYFWWVTAVLLILFPILSVAGLLWADGAMEWELGAGSQSVSCGDIVPLELRVKNPRWYPVLDGRMSLRIGNTFFGSGSDVAVSMAVRMHGESSLRLPLELKDQGRFTVALEKSAFQDLMGLVECRRRIDRECEVFALPRDGGGVEPDMEQYLSGASETEESREKGNDFSEVSDIREYIPGDRFRDIHWKLSARQDELMVKERVAVAGSEMVIVIGLPPDKRRAERILETVYGLAASLTERHLPVCLLCWNQGLFCFDEYRCGSRQAVRASYCDLYRTALSLRTAERQREYMKNCFPFLGTYLSVTEREGEVQVEMCEND